MNFKAISKNKNSWKFGNGIIKTESDWFIVASDIKTENYLNTDFMIGISKEFVHPILKETLCQSFGKFDKNNKEIFTNDIVIVPSDYGDGDLWYEETKAIVTFEHDHFKLWNLNDKHNITWQYFQWYELEIIGNKFDEIIGK